MVEIDVPAEPKMIAISCENTEGLLVSASNGLVSDNSWTCHSQLVDDWYKLGTDDMTDKGDLIHAYHNDIGEDYYDSNFSPYAEWIWLDTELEERVTTVYCRRFIGRPNYRFYNQYNNILL